MHRSAAKLTLLAVAAAVAAAAWGLFCWWTWSPDLATRVRDDAFYEYAWAANFASGRGGVVSDGVSTSGVQWLWTLLLAAVAWLFGAGALWAAPFVGGALHVAAAAAWWRIPRDRATGAVLALCWLGHPLLLREAQNGQETALAGLAATGLYAARHARQRWFVTLCVTATLARSDLFCLVVLLAWCRRGDGWWRALGAPLLAFAALAAANLWFGGGLLQDSAAPMAWLWHANLEEAWGFWRAQWWFTRPVLLGGPFHTASAFGFGAVAFLLLRPFVPRALRFAPLLAVALAALLGAHDLLCPLWCALLLALRPAASRRALPAGVLAFALGLGAVVALHWAVRWYPRDYYLAPVAVAAFVAVHRLGRWRLVLLALPVLQLVDSGRVRPEPLAGQRAMAAAGAELHRFVPARDRVGCFNSGIVTFLADVTADDARRRGVVNLDGVVDRRSFAALRARELDAWLDAQRVRFVLDGPAQFARDPAVPHASGRFFGPEFDASQDLVEVARFAVRSATAGAARPEAMRLYWRRGRGVRPPRIAEERVTVLGVDRVLWAARAGETLVMSDGHTGRVVLERVDVDTQVLLVLRDGALDPAALRVERP